MSQEVEKLVSPDELSAIVHLTPWSLVRLAAGGFIPGCKIQGKWNFYPSAVIDTLRQRAGFSIQPNRDGVMLMTPKELGVYTGVGEMIVLHLMRDGRLPFFVNKRKYLIDPEIGWAKIENEIDQVGRIDAKAVREWWNNRPLIESGFEDMSEEEQIQWRMRMHRENNQRRAARAEGGQPS